MLALAASLCFGQAASTEPTKAEIADAYRSKGGQGGLLVPGLRWEHFRIKEVCERKEAEDRVHTFNTIRAALSR